MTEQTTSTNKTFVFKSVDSIGKEEIDKIADDGFFTYGWFKTLENSKQKEFPSFYATFYENGRLEAFAPCFIDKTDQYFIFGPYVIPFMKTVLNMGSRLRFSQNHVLLCYSPFCYRSKVSLGTSLNEDKALDSVIRKIDDVCKKQKILFSSFLFVSEFDNNLSTCLQNFGYRQFFFRNCLYLDVRWNTFEDYLQSLKHGIRNRIRREMRSCKEGGVIIEEIEDFKNLSTLFSSLFSNLYAKYQKDVEAPFTPSFYESLSDYAKEKTKVFIAKKKGVIVGFSVCIRHNDVLDVFHCGFNYELMEKTDFVYFNLCYYEPIRWAIQEGIKKIYYRMTAEEVKYRRGCKPEKVYSFVKCHNKFVQAQIGNYLKIRGKLT